MSEPKTPRTEKPTLPSIKEMLHPQNSMHNSIVIKSPVHQEVRHHDRYEDQRSPPPIYHHPQHIYNASQQQHYEQHMSAWTYGSQREPLPDYSVKSRPGAKRNGLARSPQFGADEHDKTEASKGRKRDIEKKRRLDNGAIFLKIEEELKQDNLTHHLIRLSAANSMSSKLEFKKEDLLTKYVARAGALRDHRDRTTSVLKDQIGLNQEVLDILRSEPLLSKYDPIKDRIENIIDVMTFILDKDDEAKTYLMSSLD